MKRASNDATLSKLGDLYQQYIGLLECFKMQEGETILFEVAGDVTKLSKKDSFQMEIKHHLKKTPIIDRNVDFWNTIRNWYKEFNRIKDHKKLILFTTAEIDPKSALYNWNEESIERKLNILKNIGSELKKRETTFRPLFNDIFLQGNYNEGNLKSILSRMEIVNRQEKIDKIDIEFEKYIPYIPQKNRKHFIATLLGIVVSNVKKKPHIWKITYKAFVKLLQDTTPLYVQEHFLPLPTEYIQLTLPLEIEKENQDKEFVKAIRKIQYDKEIPKAISDVWKCNMTITKYYQDNLVFNKDITVYKTNLTEKLNYTREGYVIEHGQSDRNLQIKESKKLYSAVMSWNAYPFGSINPNQPFFQKGIIHDIIENKDFLWDIGDENGL
ncbi:ABC-three component system protein [Paenibacillus sp. FSL E2-0201]|uniref:ABC-three component system protein n=1 Tax=Paenibacillus sp. FSL E2-0201 TaxID=2954726 RepID=UPI0030DDBAD7